MLHQDLSVGIIDFTDAETKALSWLKRSNAREGWKHLSVPHRLQREPSRLLLSESASDDSDGWAFGAKCTDTTNAVHSALNTRAFR